MHNTEQSFGARILGWNSIGYDVYNVQVALNILGYLEGEACCDGIYGYNTMLAV